MSTVCTKCGADNHFAGNKKFHPDEPLENLFKNLGLKENMLAGKLITKEKRHELYGKVDGGSGSTKPEEYQRSQIETITGVKCLKTNTRINWRTNKLTEIAHPMVNENGYDYTEDFDGIQKFDSIKVYINLKCVVGKGGSQTRTLRDECYRFIEAQLKYLTTGENMYFANIFDGDEAHANMSKFWYLMDLPEYTSVKDHVYVGDLKDYFDWIKLLTIR